MLKPQKSGWPVVLMALATWWAVPRAVSGEEALPPTTQPSAQPQTMLTSPAFEHGGEIPQRYTADGKDVSPPLRWTTLPAEARQLALIVDDPDAPRPKPWVHWVIYGVPPQAEGLPEAVPREERLADPPGALQGRNSWDSGLVGYRGPNPPPTHGAHHYHFKLYVLNQALDLEPGLDKEQLLEAMQGHVIEQAELIGTYTRPAPKTMPIE